MLSPILFALSERLPPIPQRWKTKPFERIIRSIKGAHPENCKENLQLSTLYPSLHSEAKELHLRLRLRLGLNLNLNLSLRLNCVALKTTLFRVHKGTEKCPFGRPFA